MLSGTLHLLKIMFLDTLMVQSLLQGTSTLSYRARRHTSARVGATINSSSNRLNSSAFVVNFKFKS